MFTIVTPVLNGMPFLPAAIHSIAREKEHVAIQHIVMDAVSTDGTQEWLRENQDLGYELIIGPDQGQSDALQKGDSQKRMALILGGSMQTIFLDRSLKKNTDWPFLKPTHIVSPLAVRLWSLTKMMTLSALPAPYPMGIDTRY